MPPASNARAAAQLFRDRAEGQVHVQVLLAQYERMLGEKLRDRLCDASALVFGRAGGMFSAGTQEQIAAWSAKPMPYRLARLRMLARRAADTARDARRLLSAVADARRLLAPPRAPRKPPKQQELFA